MFAFFLSLKSKEKLFYLFEGIDYQLFGFFPGLYQMHSFQAKNVRKLTVTSLSSPDPYSRKTPWKRNGERRKGKGQWKIREGRGVRGKYAPVAAGVGAAGFA